MESFTYQYYYNSSIILINDFTFIISKLIVSNINILCFNLFSQVYKAFSLTNYGFTLFSDRNRKNEIKSSRSVYLSSLNLKHGDKIYLCPLDPDNIWAIPGPSNVDSTNGSRSSSVVSTPGSSTSLPLNGKKSSGSTSQVEEDEVDKQLWKLDGKIKRLKDKK